MAAQQSRVAYPGWCVESSMTEGEKLLDEEMGKELLWTEMLKKRNEKQQRGIIIKGKN